MSNKNTHNYDGTSANQQSLIGSHQTESLVSGNDISHLHHQQQQQHLQHQVNRSIDTAISNPHGNQGLPTSVELLEQSPALRHLQMLRYGTLNTVGGAFLNEPMLNNVSTLPTSTEMMEEFPALKKLQKFRYGWVPTSNSSRSNNNNNSSSDSDKIKERVESEVAQRELNDLHNNQFSEQNDPRTSNGTSADGLLDDNTHHQHVGNNQDSRADETSRYVTSEEDKIGGIGFATEDDAIDSEELARIQATALKNYNPSEEDEQQNQNEEKEQSGAKNAESSVNVRTHDELNDYDEEEVEGNDENEKEQSFKKQRLNEEAAELAASVIQNEENNEDVNANSADNEHKKAENGEEEAEPQEGEEDEDTAQIRKLVQEHEEEEVNSENERVTMESDVEAAVAAAKIAAEAAIAESKYI